MGAVARLTLNDGSTIDCDVLIHSPKKQEIAYHKVGDKWNDLRVVPFSNVKEWRQL